MASQKFEDSMKRLEELVQTLESGELPLDDALKAFEEGMRLVKSCSDKLEEAEKKVTLLLEQSGGKSAEVPFELDEQGNTQ